MQRVMLAWTWGILGALAALVLVACASTLPYVLGKADALAPAEARFYRSYLRILAGSLPYAVDVEAALAELTRQLAAMPARVHVALRLGTWLVDLSPIIIGGRFRRFVHLDADGQRAHLARLDGQRWAFLPGVQEGLQTLLLMVVGGQATTHAALGIDRAALIQAARTRRERALGATP